MADETSFPTGTPVPPEGIMAGSGPPPFAVAPQPVPPPSPAKPAAKTPQHQDSFREFIETVVFVVVLVLILKTFLAEAFVIPTGSMATTLLGYHKEVTCQSCGYRFLVNTSKESDPAERDRHDVVVRCTCPNCYFPNEMVPRPLDGNPGHFPGENP